MAKVDDTVLLQVQRMGQFGEGVGHDADGRVVFVSGALPGENVQARITEVRKNFSRATTQKVLRPTINRIVPRCPIFEQCGGCAFQHWDYGQELAYKEDRVRQAFIRIAHVDHPPVEPIVGADDPYGYRNKGQFPWGGQSGHTYLGLFARGTHEVIATEKCDIQDSLVNEVLAKAPPVANTLGIEPYHEGSGQGILRHLLVRISRREQKSLVLIVVHHWDDRLFDMAHQLLQDIPSLRGVGVNINADRTNRVLGNETRLLAGEDTLVDEILGKSFILSFESFFQVNPLQVGRLYSLALQHIPQGSPEVWDLYAGVGTLAILASDRAKVVKALEINQRAVEDGKRNIAMNHVQNVAIMAGRVEEVIGRWVKQGKTPPSSVIMDPPRAGLLPQVIESLRSLGASRLIYVSCNPDTLARDVALLKPLYRLEHVAPVDMFPRTDHVEAVAAMVAEN